MSKKGFFFEESSFWYDAVKQFRKNRLAIIGLSFLLFVAFFAVFGPLIVDSNPFQVNISQRLSPPSWNHLLGTDSLGRDILIRIFYGARTSLIVSFLSVTISLVVGTSLGAIAGFYGGAWDEMIMRFMDILFSFPAMLLAMTIIAIIGQGTRGAIIAIGVVYTPIFARITRGGVLDVRQLDFIESARSIGAGQFRLISRHALPNCMAPIIVETTLSLGFALLSESALSFLGLGTQPPNPSLGRMLSEGRMYISDAPWLGLFPGLAILLVVLGFNLMGDGLRDVLDPKIKNEEIGR